MKSRARGVLALTLVAVSGAWLATPKASAPGKYDHLLALFGEWRAFQKPKLTDGVPDYTPAAMTRQERDLPAYQRRLAAIDPTGWPVRQQVDWHIVRAEMNGLE